MFNPFAPTVGIPASEALFERYDNPDDLNSAIDYRGLEGGAPPARIPRLWNIGLGSLANLTQFGEPHNFWRLQLSPPIIVPPNRGDLRSVSAAMGDGRDRMTADTMYVPALFIGWNPRSALK